MFLVVRQIDRVPRDVKRTKRSFQVPLGDIDRMCIALRADITLYDAAGGLNGMDLRTILVDLDNKRGTPSDHARMGREKDVQHAASDVGFDEHLQVRHFL